MVREGCRMDRERVTVREGETVLDWGLFPVRKEPPLERELEERGRMVRSAWAVMDTRKRAKTRRIIPREKIFMVDHLRSDNSASTLLVHQRFHFKPKNNKGNFCAMLKQILIYVFQVGESIKNTKQGLKRAYFTP